MLNKKNNKVAFLAQAAVIAALYTALTYVAAAMNLAYGAVQFRFSEALTLLPIFTPAAVPGLALGCFISNLASPFGPVDWIFGTLATLLAAICTRAVRNVELKKIPWLAPFMPVIFNAVIIGFEVACFSAADIFAFSNFSFEAFISIGLSVGIGQFLMCYGLGIPLVIMIRKTKIDKLLQ